MAWSIERATPVADLPHWHRHGGRMHSHLSGRSVSGLAEIGIYEAPAKPTHDPATEHAPEWDGDSLEWVVIDKTAQEIADETAAALAARKVTMAAAVDAERDARLVAGVEYGGHVFQTRDIDQKRMTGAVQLATLAVMGGAQAEDLRWADPAADFAFISRANVAVPLDAQGMIALGTAAAMQERALIFHARALKDAIDAAADDAALDGIDTLTGWPPVPDPET